MAGIEVALGTGNQEKEKGQVDELVRRDTPGTVIAAIKLYLKYGDEEKGKSHNGYYGAGGWPYEVLLKFIKESA